MKQEDLPALAWLTVGNMRMVLCQKCLHATLTLFPALLHTMEPITTNAEKFDCSECEFERRVKGTPLEKPKVH